MQVVILCGGKGTRLSEYTEDIPKPLVEVGNKPILHHLMSLYAHFGHKDFILCLGYKGEKIKEYFKDTQKLKISGVLKNKVFHDNKDWNIEFVHSGENANKAQRLFKAKEMIKDDTFLLSYGDDLCDVNINKVIDFHQKNNK